MLPAKTGLLARMSYQKLKSNLNTDLNHWSGGRLGRKALKRGCGGRGSCGCGQQGRGIPLLLLLVRLLIQLLQHEPCPVLNQFPQVHLAFLVLPVYEQPEGRGLSESPEGAEEVAGLAALSLRAVQHPEEEA